MGLSGRKVKQRIPQDPRNLSWADDAARFGSNYLSKFGWDSSKGLGAGGDGRTSHIKVSHKLDMLGIGAAHQKDPNGIAWKQNKDFENLLKRLNETVAVQTPVESEDEKDEYMGEDISVDETEKKKKRKHKGGEDGSERKKKKTKDAEIDQQAVVVQESMEADIAVVAGVKKLAVPRHRAHRARAIAAKNISSKSAAHISEILGVAPTLMSLSTALSAEFQPGKLTPLTDTDGLEIEKITTSTKSLAEYFKEKLASKSGGSNTPTPSSDSRAEEDDSYDTPRIGIGASRVRHSETEIVNEATQRMGLSKFSSLMSSSFLASTSSFVVKDEAEEVMPASDVETERKKEKKEKGKGKKKAGEEGDGVEKVGKKEKKKDRKGKDKAVEINEEKSSDKAEKKDKKKDKEATFDEDIEKTAAGFSNDGSNDNEEPSGEQTVADEVKAVSRKKEKRKRKLEKTGTKTKSEEDGKESHKEKKKKRRTTSEES